MLKIFIYFFYLNLSSAYPEVMPNNLNLALKQFGLRLDDGNHYVLSKNQLRSGKQFQLANIIAEKNGTRIDIELTKPIVESEVANMINTQFDLILKLYGPQFTPYQGAVTNISTCTEEYKPKSKTIFVLGKATKILIANSTDRFVLGVCEKSEIKLKAVIAFVYDSDQSELVQFRIFIPIDKFVEKDILQLLKKIKIDKK